LLSEGVIVARKEVEGQYGDKLPVARRYYHLADWKFPKCPNLLPNNKGALMPPFLFHKLSNNSTKTQQP
jgi:hypothetical protein